MLKFSPKSGSVCF